MRVAAVQMQCIDDRDDDLDRAERLVADASDSGAELVVLPELFASLHRGTVMRERAEPFDGPTITWARRVAIEHRCALVPGSFVERDGHELFNTTCVIDAHGELLATYRKIHLFDVEVDGAASRESATFSPGDSVAIARTDTTSSGLTICYDLRFPEVFRIETLLGATMIAVPSAFTATTGRDHWEPLLRARAIENQVTVIAAAQWGASPDGIERHGHAMIIDPWGRVLADAGAIDDTVITAEIDPDTTTDIRRRLPALEHRRPSSYRWPE